MMDLDKLVCRPALPQDTRDILDLTSHIWEGHDYIPLVWNDWLKDEQGLLAVALFGKRVVGMGKLTKLDEEDWWLEGLRVHPDYEGRGFASHIHDYLLQIWHEIGNGVIRLTTSSQRLAVHHICQERGFQKVAEISSFSAKTNSSQNIPDQFHRVTEAEFNHAWAYASNNPLQTYWPGFMDLGWQWLPLRAPMLLRFIQNGKVFWWKDQQGLILLGEDTEENEQAERFAVIRWLACDKDGLINCLQDIQSLAIDHGYPKISWFAPLQPNIEQALMDAGFENDWDFSLYLFEKWYNPAGK